MIRNMHNIYIYVYKMTMNNTNIVIDTCMYVCMYMSIYVCIYIYVYIYTYTYTYTIYVHAWTVLSALSHAVANGSTVGCNRSHLDLVQEDQHGTQLGPGVNYG